MMNSEKYFSGQGIIIDRRIVIVFGGSVVNKVATPGTTFQVVPPLAVESRPFLLIMSSKFNSNSIYHTKVYQTDTFTEILTHYN